MYRKQPYAWRNNTGQHMMSHVCEENVRLWHYRNSSSFIVMKSPLDRATGTLKITPSQYSISQSAAARVVGITALV